MSIRLTMESPNIPQHRQPLTVQLSGHDEGGISRSASKNVDPATQLAEPPSYEKPAQPSGLITAACEGIGWLFPKSRALLMDASSPSWSLTIDTSFSSLPSTTFTAASAGPHMTIKQRYSRMNSWKMRLTSNSTSSRESVPYTPPDETVDGSRPVPKGRTQSPKPRKAKNGPFFERILSPQILEWHSVDPVRCTAGLSDKPEKRCSKKAKTPISTQQLRNSLRTISTMTDLTSAIARVESLLESVSCAPKSETFSHTNRARKQLDQLTTDHENQFKVWLLRVCAKDIEIDQDPDLEDSDNNATSIKTKTTIQSPRQAAMSLTRSADQSSAKAVPAVLAPPIKPYVASTVSIWPMVAVTARSTMPVFEKYWKKDQNTEILIRRWLLKPMTVLDLDTALLYGFWYPGNFGHVKIGYTTATTENRFKQWSKCGHTVQNCLNRELSSITKDPIRNARRLEHLIHAELQHYRRRELNCRCKAKHQEWFEVNEEHVRRVVKKWFDFFAAAERYAPHVGGDLIRTNLSAKDIDELCRPVPTPKPFLLLSTKPGVTSSSQLSQGLRQSLRVQQRDARRPASVSPRPSRLLNIEDGDDTRRKRRCSDVALTS